MARIEKWKPIPGYEEYYEISNFGNIRSLDRVCGQMPSGSDRHIKGQLMTPTDNGNGYLIIHLKKGGKRKPAYIHRLVAEAFVEKPEGCDTVNHVDYNTKNNAADNLEWTTQKENIRHSRHRMCKPRSVTKTNTGEKYISRVKSGKYKVSIRKAKVWKEFETLEQAVIYRNEVLNEIGSAI